MTDSRGITRTIVYDIAAVAVVAVPTLGPVIRKSGEETDRYDTSITPPGYAFAIWAPIFGGILADAVQASLPSRRQSPDNASTRWPLSIAYGCNALWSLAAQSDRFQYTPVLLPAAVTATAVAYHRLHPEENGESITSASTGLLLGWTSLAALVNVFADARRRGARPDSRASIVASALGSLAASTGLSALVARSRRGYLTVAAAASWGLATTALDTRRPVLIRAVSGIGAVAVVGSAMARNIPVRV